ncbi:unnamed protein product [Lactuca saligna]|uniref:Uncharacterized protein n=1 Tax=Lactuca saligna TaxID=75948 RepID=A0AA35YYD0_LACSI|nr:unnamed protein product [Lactuca saligna]
MHVPYLCFLGLILSREEGYVEIHGIIIPNLDISSKTINPTPSEGDLIITEKMQKWINKPYGCESSDSEEENDEDNKEVDDEEKDIDKDEEELVVDNGKEFAQGINSPPSINKHI